MSNVLALTYEFRRLKALLSYQILNTPNEAEFDTIVQTAAHIFNAPAAAVTLIDENRQWIKASVGLQVCETDRKYAVCNYTIRKDTINEIEDLRADERFNYFPFVTGDPYLRYYAGVPLTTENNFNIGALCIMDTVTRALNDEQKALLGALGRVVMAQIEVSSKNKEVQIIQEVQTRIAHLINRKTSEPVSLSKEINDLRQKYADYRDVLNADDLIAMKELMQKHYEYTICLLQEQIQWKKQELQHAIDIIKDDSLKQLVSNIMMNADAGNF